MEEEMKKKEAAEEAAAAEEAKQREEVGGWFEWLAELFALLVAVNGFSGFHLV